jgi:hypothetical protein
MKLIDTANRVNQQEYFLKLITAKKYSSEIINSMLLDMLISKKDIGNRIAQSDGSNVQSKYERLLNRLSSKNRVSRIAKPSRRLPVPTTAIRNNPVEQDSSVKST